MEILISTCHLPEHCTFISNTYKEYLYVPVVTRPRWNDLQWPSSNWILYFGIIFIRFELLFVGDQFPFLQGKSRRHNPSMKNPILFSSSYSLDIFHLSLLQSIKINPLLNCIRCAACVCDGSVRYPSTMREVHSFKISIYFCCCRFVEIYRCFYLNFKWKMNFVHYVSFSPFFRTISNHLLMVGIEHCMETMLHSFIH